MIYFFSSALADLDAPVGALAIVIEAERRQLLGAWSFTPLPVPETLCIHDHFFALGGHSLLATQLIFRLREAFQIDLPLRMIYDTPSIAQQALVIEAAIREDLAELSDEEAQMLLDN